MPHRKTKSLFSSTHLNPSILFHKNIPAACFCITTTFHLSSDFIFLSMTSKGGVLIKEIWTKLAIVYIQIIGTGLPLYGRQPACIYKRLIEKEEKQWGRKRRKSDWWGFVTVLLRNRNLVLSFSRLVWGTPQFILLTSWNGDPHT